ncbi:hypothetical protein E4K10_18130 [Streptomyces sp. T1317-0309]|nr:hypothetical protein E4K10_18130 [Streptomyces sp. T1317-0309]
MAARETRAFLARAENADQAVTVVRTPLTLREHPAPLNLAALDAAMHVERDLFDLADQVADTVQRPWDRGNPARWTPASNRDIGRAAAASPGSRAHGVHFATTWLEGRALDEQYGELFRPAPAHVMDNMDVVAARARRTVEAALNRDGRTTTLADDCPWCGGTLFGQVAAGDVLAATVTCTTGPDCWAPVVLVNGRRMWKGADLAGLWGAIDAARRRAA